MNEDGTVKSHNELILPPTLVTKVDVSRLVAEVERVDNGFIESEVREKVGMHDGSNPTLSGQLAEFLEKNQIDINNERARSSLVSELRQLKNNLPVIHVTFSAMADGESLHRLVAWFRDAIHPQTVLEVGLQPSLVAGVYVRTTNHVHDLSLRTALREHRGLLAKELEAIRGNQ